VARNVFHGKRGELRQAYREGQEDQLGSLGLVLNIIVLWNTIYMDSAVQDEDVEKLSPLQCGHILLVEQIDRLTSLSNSDWMTLKKQIEQHELRIVSLDVPTSWQALSDKDPSQADPITRAVITAINNMLIDLMAAMSHKDWLSRRQRQKQGIERAHTWVNIGANRPIRNDIRKSCTTDRSRN
jgi:DNA invertase Pin-like site-specific DNA recombinase